MAKLRGTPAFQAAREPVIACLLLLASWLSSAVPVVGADCGAPRRVAAGSLDEQTWRQLNGIYEAFGDQRYDDAYQDLQRMLDRAGYDPYLQAVLNQALGQVEWARGNYESALIFLDRAIDLDALPDPSHYAVIYQLAQIYYSMDRYEEARVRLDDWLCGTRPEDVSAIAWVLKASIHAHLEQYPAALQAIDAAIDMDPEPPADWFQLRLAAELELGKYDRAAATLEQLIARWPDVKRYWTQLARIRQQQGQNEQALAVLALAAQSGLLNTPSELSWLAGLYRNAGVPYKAAETLETGIRDEVVPPTREAWSQVADAWYAAGELERALAAYEAAGAAGAGGGPDLRRGYLLADLERWDEVLQALTRAIDQGGLDPRQVGEAYLLRGMAHFHLEQFDAADADWDQASAYESSRDAAQQWKLYLREERSRLAS